MPLKLPAKQKIEHQNRTVRVPTELLWRVALQAKRSGVSENQFLVYAIEQMVKKAESKK